jgi:hypothetical protein
MSHVSRTGGTIERSHHRVYETVGADDLNAHEETEETLRTWHNRALHATYGVSFGLEVEPAPGAFAAKVQPGLAYDATGRDLLVGETTIVPLPTDPMGMTLVVRAEERGVSFGWVPTAGFRIASGVPLARTVSQTVLTQVVLVGFPSTLRPDKFDYDPANNILTVRGLISDQELDVLKVLANDTQTLNKLTNAHDAWPFEAPRPSRARGLRVDILPYDPRTNRTPPLPLWQAVITPGTVLTANGTLLSLSSVTVVDLKSGSDKLALVLKKDNQGNGSVELAEGASAKGDDFLLAKISLPPDAIISLDDDNPIDDTAPLDPPAPKTIKTAIDELVNDKKILYQASPVGGAGPPGKITITGLLTVDDANTIVQIVRNSEVARDNASDKLDNIRIENKPQVPPISDQGERIPLFPPRSRPLARPRIATGLSLPGRTEWKLKRADEVGITSAGPGFVAYEATVVIESAGFTEPPQVFAWVERSSTADRAAAEFPRLFQGGVVGTRGLNGKPYAPIDTRTFLFRVWTVDGDVALKTLIPDNPNSLSLAEWLLQNLYVRWLAVQSDPEPNWDEWPGLDTLPERIWP